MVVVVVVVVAVVVVAVVVVVVVVVMSDNKVGSLGWSIINLLSIFCHKKVA